ncbi:MAG TPA: hypothetical protein VJT72_12380 [Pseudonocardiaceae bacterium]|nr:hypothetical protein [Pseudonocardiaceae bacterium]
MQINQMNSKRTLGLRVGELVEVRSAKEILATLDENGELDSLPFMPEMLPYCGQRYTVYKVAHKLCDTQTWTGMRRMHNAVHLAGVRCDGQAHGSCQTACLMYWKEAWLKRVDNAADPGPIDQAPEPARCTLPLLDAATREEPFSDGAPRFSCQATELLRAAPEQLPMRDLDQYVRDIRTGNAGVVATLRGVLIALFNRFQGYSKRVLPRRLWLREGMQWGFVKGSGTRTPTARTDLRPGELVRIKSKDEIMKTLNKDRLNRGMGFEEEMSRYCGRQARVLRRVDQCIDERTGRLLSMKNPCIILEDTVCAGAYNVNCPRAIYSFWREIWLERIDEPTHQPG